MEILDAGPVSFDLDELLPRLHVAPGSEDAAMLAELAARARAVARPKALLDVCYVEGRGPDSVTIGGITFTSRVLAVNLQQAHRIFAYVATCGVELDTLANQVHDPLQRFWMEEMKIIALGAASARLRQHIDATYQPGPLSAMNPGSLQDWPITQQTQLFALLGGMEEAIGVRLTDSFLMVPNKSISGIYFPSEVSFQSCRLCPREVCPGRQAPYDPSLWKERYGVRQPR